MRSFRWILLGAATVAVLGLMLTTWAVESPRLEAAISSTPLYLPFVMRGPAAANTPAPATATPAPAATHTPLPAATATATANIPITGGPVVIAVGPGGADNLPHQIVRAANDRVYLISAAQYSPLIRVYLSKIAAPASAADFAAAVTASEAEIPLSVEAAYDGAGLIFVLVNTRAGHLKVYPFSLAQNAFQPAVTLAADSASVAGDYVGTQGISAMVDKTGVLQLAYWAAGNHILQRAYTYGAANNTFTLVGVQQQVDTAGSANHPALAVSPLDNTLTVAWVSQATAPAKILARTRSAAGAWGSVESVSTSAPWTSPNFGINIDQGPSLLIGADGTRHLIYIQDYDSTNDYGRLHYAANAGAGWTDTALSTYSHAPALGLNSAGTLYLLGHGHPLDKTGPCLSMDDMCYQTKPAGGSWGAPQLLLAHAVNQSLDSSPSTKWSVLGWNRPETLEFVFFGVPFVNTSFDYSSPTLFYARLP